MADKGCKRKSFGQISIESSRAMDKTRKKELSKAITLNPHQLHNLIIERSPPFAIAFFREQNSRPPTLKTAFSRQKRWVLREACLPRVNANDGDNKT